MIRRSSVGDQSQEDTVRRVAALARLELTAEETRRLGGDLAHILSAFRALEQAQVEGVAPLAAPGESGGPGGLREDRLEPGLARDELLARAPEASPGPEGGPPRFFRVPPAIVRGAPDPGSAEPRP